MTEPMIPPFVRRVELGARPGEAVAEVEDHEHHFVVTVSHADGVVTGVAMHAVRWPWSTCTGAATQLQEFVGLPVGLRPATARADLHCTHQLDLALAAVRFAGLRRAHRRYDLRADGYLTPDMRASIVRDDGWRLDWELHDRVITSPAHHAGHALGSGFTGWAVTLDPDEAEAVLLLRRAAYMAPARMFDLDQYDVLSGVGLPVGACWSAQPERIEIALRHRV